MNEVYFADARVRELLPDKTLPAKFTRLLKKLDLASTVKGRRVAIKIHTGGNLGFTTIPPLFLRIMVRECKEAGAKKVAVMDGNIDGAVARGYTREVLEAPVVSCFGRSGDRIYRKKVGMDGLQYAEFGADAWDVDAFIDFSHLKAHGVAGFGGAIKNIAMGCVTGRTRGDIHRMEGGIVWDGEKCVRCLKCVKECPNRTNRFDEKGQYEVNFHNCTFCQHCILVCPKNALELDSENFEKFQEALARVAAVFLKHLAPDRVLFINILTSITIYCDCWGMSTPSLVPDIGILAGRNIVAVEKASLDRIKVSKLMPEGLPIGRKLARKTGHLFHRIHGKDPYVQVRKMDELGFGPAQYKIIEVR